MSDSIPFIPRDISWLSFNERVLQEAKDTNNPLLERLKFLAIYSNNLDEFFRVRMANHRNLMRVGKKNQKKLDFDPRKMVRTIQKTVNKQQAEFSRIFSEEIIPELKQHGIILKRRLDLNKEQSDFVEDYFEDSMLPYAQPVLLVKQKIRPFLNNAALYLTILLIDKEDSKREHQYAVVKIPTDYLPRFIQLPSPPDEHHLILLDDIVRHEVSWMFPGYEIQDTFSVKLTRDAELYIDDEFSGDLVQKIRDSLSKRQVGPASRFVYDREMPSEMLSFLQDAFDLEKYDILPEGRYHNNFDFFKFPDFGMTQLKISPLSPLPYLPLEDMDDFFAAMKERDHLVHFPYHSYESVIRFFEEAAKDPKVTHIKIVQYRVAKKSRIMNALVDAVKAGKQVTVFIEVKARFDEEANLRWGEKLELAGVRVHYSFPGVKVHSKIALIRRVENKKGRLYTYLSTGNFHEDTAKIYSDFGLFTADSRMSNEVARVFSYLETVKVPANEFEHLLVGQFNLRRDLESKIKREIANAKAGKKASMILKMNSLQDDRMINLLYEASNAGVKIALIIRGLCCLVSGVKGYSENIEAFSIVDRYLEHARVFIFHNDGNEEVYLSSADWMVRNLSYRIEVTFPVYDDTLIQQIKYFMRIQMHDNVKSRVLDANMSNKYRQTEADLAVQSQLETYFYLKRREEEYRQAAEDNQKDDGFENSL